MRIIRMDGSHISCRFCGQVIQITCAHTVIKALNDALSNLYRLYMFLIEPIAQLFNPGGNFIKTYVFSLPTSFYYLHDFLIFYCKLKVFVSREDFIFLILPNTSFFIIPYPFLKEVGFSLKGD